jgi:hypothetical protein
VSGQRHAPSAVFPEERTPGTHCTGGWVGLRAGLDTEVRGKIICPCRGSNPDRPVVQSVVRHYTDWATPAPLRQRYRHINEESSCIVSVIPRLIFSQIRAVMNCFCAPLLIHALLCFLLSPLLPNLRPLPVLMCSLLRNPLVHGWGTFKCLASFAPTLQMQWLLRGRRLSSYRFANLRRPSSTFNHLLTWECVCKKKL